MRLSRLQIAWLPALLVATTVAYLNALVGPLQFDDHLLPLDRATQQWSAWWESLRHTVRPLLKSSFVMSHALGEQLHDIPLGHHALNLGIHLVVVILAYQVATKLGQTIFRDLPGATTPAVAAASAAMLALHPLATEAVTYISGRSVALGTLFGLAALLLHMHSARARSRVARFGWTVGAVLSCVAAVLTREAMIIVPALLLLWEWGRVDQRTAPFAPGGMPAALRRTSVYWLLVAGATLWLLLNTGYANLVGVSRVVLQGRIGETTLLPALEYFVTRLLLVAPLSIDPAPRMHDSAMVHRLVLGGVLLAVLWAAWRVRQHRPHWLFGMVWILLWIAPMYLLPLRHDPVSERHFYPALLGVGLILALEGARLAGRGRLARRGVAVLGIGVLLALTVTTMLRNVDYLTEVDLWEAAAARTGPGETPKARVFHNLGVAYMKEARWERAVASFDRAIELDPGYRSAQLYRARAQIKLATGDPDAEPEI